MKKLVFLFALFILASHVHAQDTVWWLNGATEKIVASTTPTQTPLQLSSGRLEYAPFQLAILASDQDRQFVAPTMVFDEAHFTVEWYEEFFIPILQKPKLAEVFTLARITTAPAIPDGLRPLEDSFAVPAGQPGVLWVDVYVMPDTPAGTYNFDVTFEGITQTASLTVYEVDIPPTNAMSIIIPTKKDDNVSFYSYGDDDAYLRDLNRLLIDNNIVPGTFAGTPVLTGDTWDFSVFNDELNALPEGAKFYAPMPYNVATKEYVFADQDGNPYTKTNFQDTFFTQQLENYLVQLAQYLDSMGRLDGALAYPKDETVWVADEPDHNGADGYEHLADWKTIVNKAGLRITASRVSPAPYAPDWLPSADVTDDTHVHIDLFDAGLEPYTQWMNEDGHSSSVYLNHYGDLMDLPAAINRGVVWHIYGRGLNMIAGYEATDWFNEKFDLLDPWTQADQIAPKFGGYGVGALVYPGSLPSIRIKMLREGVEDARLMDYYGFTFTPDEARAFAKCLSPVALADANPPANLWDLAHEALLKAITTNTPVDTSLCQPLPNYVDQQIVADMEDNALSADWTIDNADFATVTSPWDGTLAYQVTYTSVDSAVNLWLGGKNWSGYDTVLIDVQNPTPYYVEFDFAIGDDQGTYLLLRPGATNIAPNSTSTLSFPLVVPFNVDKTFNWSGVNYIDLYVNTTIERTDGYEDEQVYNIGARTLIFDNIRLAKKQ